MLLLLGILNLQFALNFVVPGAKSTEGGAVGFNGIGDAARIKRIGIGKRLAILINMVFLPKAVQYTSPSIRLSALAFSSAEMGS